ncbi:hypothetical protein N499_1265A, partial [Wolbachia pipientis wVitA]
MTHFFEP